MQKWHFWGLWHSPLTSDPTHLWLPSPHLLLQSPSRCCSQRPHVPPSTLRLHTPYPLPTSSSCPPSRVDGQDGFKFPGISLRERGLGWLLLVPMATPLVGMEQEDPGGPLGGGVGFFQLLGCFQPPHGPACPPGRWGGNLLEEGPIEAVNLSIYLTLNFNLKINLNGINPFSRRCFKVFLPH